VAVASTVPPKESSTLKYHIKVPVHPPLEIVHEVLDASVAPREQAPPSVQEEHSPDPSGKFPE